MNEVKKVMYAGKTFVIKNKEAIPEYLFFVFHIEKYERNGYFRRCFATKDFEPLNIKPGDFVDCVFRKNDDGSFLLEKVVKVGPAYELFFNI